LQSLIEKDEIAAKDLFSIGLRPKRQCASLIEDMKDSSLNLRLYAALAIQRAFRYRAWRKQHIDGIQHRLREVHAQKTLSKGLAAMTESKWLIARDIFEAGLDEQTGSPGHIGLQQALAKAQLELEQEDSEISNKDKKLQRKQHDATLEEELRADAAKKEVDRFSRLEATQTAADDLMIKIESGEWDKQEQKRREELAASIVAAEQENQRQKELAIKEALLAEAEAEKEAKLEAKQKKQEEKQVTPPYISRLKPCQNFNRY
jgi:hypothetical protein